MQNQNKQNINEIFNSLNEKVIGLYKNPSFSGAKDLSCDIVRLLGVNVAEKRERYSFLFDQKFNKNENWFEWHDIFIDKRAGELLEHDEGLPLEIKLYWLNKASPSRIKGVVHFTDNYEDNDRTRDDKRMKVAIDVIINPDTNGLFLALSNYGVVRVLEIKGSLNNTQKKILSKWCEIGLADNKTERGYLHTSLWDSFELKTVNEEFYSMISQSFTVLQQHLFNEKIFNEDLSKQFANRLVGRLLFVWFLRKKNFIFDDKIKYFDTSDLNDTEYYNERLSKLFFDTLNIPIENRDALAGDLKTPYLNGGLFYEYNIDKKKNDLTFPKGFFSELYSNLNEYNFTTDESTPDFEQIAIDPEMLGRIFENLLASMITETGEQARKAKGAFYTPREIVQYMCRESIREYLYKNVGEDKYKLEIDRIIDTPDYEWAINESNKVRDVSKKDNFDKVMLVALENLKILDPACGSGAFPIGVMQNLLRLYKRLNRSVNEYEVKIKILEKNIYGVDIEPMAVEISRLRAFLALVVDQGYNEKNKNGGIDTLPNLEFKFVCADSLTKLKTDQSLYDGIIGKSKKRVDLMGEMYKIKKQYFKAGLLQKQKLEDKLDKLVSQSSFLESDYYKQLKTYHPIRQISSAAFYDPYLMHDVEDGFDIVIGNPPYGGKNISNEMKKQMGLGSKDIYGAFIYRSLCDPESFLKKDGLLSFIVSDTFMTIKSHLQLRQQIMKQKIHRMIRVHPDTFKATVNTVVILLQKTDNFSNNICEMADFTNVSIHGEHDLFLKILAQTKNEEKKDISTDRYAIFYYPQKLININSNKPFFVGKAKFFELMNDVMRVVQKREVSQRKVNIREIKINDKKIDVVGFGDIADVRVGLQTGDNDYYIYQNSEARGTYKNINDYKEYLLTDADIKKVVSDEIVRKKVIKKGFHKNRDESNFDDDLWFEGRFIIPYDKGGESYIDVGWLPNYYVPTNYFIDWSQTAVERMRTLTRREKNKLKGKKGGDNSVCSRIQNSNFYFLSGLTLSYTGVYAPNLKYNSKSIFDVGGSSVFSKLNNDLILGIFCSKLNKFFAKVFIDHTVNFQVDEVKNIPFVISTNNRLKDLVQDIIEKQKKDLKYDYMSNEQKEIDKIVYEMYGLNEDDIQEVEKWYARRYPKLRKWCYINNSNYEKSKDN